MVHEYRLEEAMERIADSLEEIVKMVKADTPQIDISMIAAMSAIASQVKFDPDKIPKKLRLV